MFSIHKLRASFNSISFLFNKIVVIIILTCGFFIDPSPTRANTQTSDTPKSTATNSKNAPSNQNDLSKKITNWQNLIHASLSKYHQKAYKAYKKYYQNKINLEKDNEKSRRARKNKVIRQTRYSKAALKKRYPFKVKKWKKRTVKVKGKWVKRSRARWVKSSRNIKTYNKKVARLNRIKKRKLARIQSDYNKKKIQDINNLQHALLKSEKYIFNLFSNAALSCQDSAPQKELTVSCEAFPLYYAIRFSALAKNFAFLKKNDGPANSAKLKTVLKAVLKDSEEFLAKNPAAKLALLGELRQAGLSLTKFKWPSWTKLIMQPRQKKLRQVLSKLSYLERDFLKSGQMNLYSVVLNLKIKDLKDLEALAPQYVKLNLYLDSENYGAVAQTLNDIKERIDDSKRSGHQKAIQYVRHSVQKVNFLFLKGDYEASADLSKRIHDYIVSLEQSARKSNSNKHPSINEDLAELIDPKSGMNHSKQAALLRQMQAKIYTGYNPNTPTNISEILTKASHVNEDELERLKELAKVMKSWHSAWQKDLDLAMGGKSKIQVIKNLRESVYRLQLLEAQVYQYWDVQKSASLSEDIMYKAQENRMGWIEYLATLHNGFAKIKLHKYRQARVDFTKVKTILYGLGGGGNFAELDWIIGLGRTLVELSEYSMTESSTRKRLGRKQKKSIRYLISHARFSLKSLEHVKVPVKVAWMRTSLAPYVNWSTQLAAVRKVNDIYGLDGLNRTLKLAEDSMKKYRNRSNYARFMERKLKTEQFKFFSGLGKSSKKMTLLSKNLNSFGWNPTLERILRDKHYWSIH